MNIFDKFKKQEEDYQLPPSVADCDYQQICNKNSHPRRSNISRLFQDFSKDELHDDRTLMDYNIRGGDVLYLVLRLTGGCFPANTMIQMPNGLQMPIDQIKVEDEILTFNLEINGMKISMVTGTYIGLAESFIKITTNHGNIICTPNHKLLTKNGWKSVQNHPCDKNATLNKDDLLIHYQFGPVQIIEIEHIYGKEELIYDLSVEHDHNFIVEGFIAHNALIHIQIQNQIYDCEISSEYETLHSLQLKIKEKSNIPIEKQKLTYNGKDITNRNLNLKDIQCKKGSTLQLEILDQSQNIIQQKIDSSQISFFLKTITRNEYPIKLDKQATFKQLKYIFTLLENIEPIDSILCMYNGRILTEMDEVQNIKRIKPFSTVILIDSRYGISGILLYQSLKDIQIKGIKALKNSLCFVNQSQLSEFIDSYLHKFIPTQKDKSFFQKCPVEYFLAIGLWTSCIVYRQINKDIDSNDYNRWHAFLKFLSSGLKYCPYYQGDVYRGIKNYQNFDWYQSGKNIEWKQVSALSKYQKIGERFSNQQGTLFSVRVVGAKDVSHVSVVPEEEEVLLMPFSCFHVENVIKQENSWALVNLREISIPRTTQIIIWVDDVPQKNYKLISEIEIEFQDISIIMCMSTEEALNVFKLFRWMHLLDNSRFRVISDMVRNENGIWNYYAGIDLLYYLYNELHFSGESMIFCRDTKKAQQNCQERGIMGNYRVSSAIKEAQQFASFK